MDHNGYGTQGLDDDIRTFPRALELRRDSFLPTRIDISQLVAMRVVAPSSGHSASPCVVAQICALTPARTQCSLYSYH